MEFCISFILCIIKSFPNLFDEFVDISFFSFLQKYPVHYLNPDCTSKNPNSTIIFFHGIAWVMTIGSKHGQHTPLMVKKNAYAGHKCGSQRTWMTMSKFCHYHMIIMSWQVSIIMWLKLAETSFKAWLHIQGMTISLFMGIIFFIVFQLKIIECILTSLNKLLMWNIILVHTKSRTLWNFQIHWREHEMGLWC